MSSHAPGPPDDAPPRGRVPKRLVDGTHRSEALEVTWERIRPHLLPLGITRVAMITGLDRVGVPVATAVRPNARSLAVSQGKGTTPLAARVSAAMEAIELAHAEEVALPLLFASRAALRGQRVADVERLPRSDAGRYHPEAKMLWAPARDLVAGGEVLVPYELVHADFTPPLPPGSGAFLAGSNGLASGNHLHEAIGHGLYEVIERDARSLFRLLPPPLRARARLDLATVDDPACRGVIERLEAAGLAVTAWDITSDLGVPAFQCRVLERDPRPLGPVTPASGAGCHPDRAVALLRALTEAAQSRLTLIAGARDDWTLASYRANQDRDRHAAHAAEAAAAGPLRRFPDLPDLATDTIDGDVVAVLGRLHARGVDEVLVVDLTRAAVGIPVARVIVPGLEGVSEAPGYLPGARALGRLREVHGG